MQITLLDRRPLLAFAIGLATLCGELHAQSFGILEQRHVDAIVEAALQRGAARCWVGNLGDGNARTFIDETLYVAAQQPIRHLQILQGLMAHQQGQALEREYRAVEAEVERLAGLSRRDRARQPEGREEAVTRRYRELHAIFYPEDIQASLEAHRALQEEWISEAIRRIEALPLTGESWSQLALFDARWAEPYQRQCASWTPDRLRSRFTFTPTSGRADFDALNAALLNKFRTILREPNNPVERLFLDVQSEDDYYRLFRTHVGANGSHAAQALDETGLHQAAFGSGREAYLARLREAEERRMAARQRQSRAARLASSGFAGWVPGVPPEEADLLLLSESEVGGVLVQTGVMCDYQDATKSVLLQVIVSANEADVLDRRWSTRGESRVVPLSVSTDGAATRLAGLTPQEGKWFRTNVNYLNAFVLGFIDREALDGAQASDAIGALSDMFSRTIIHAGLTTGNGFVLVERAVGSSTFVLKARFEANGKSLEWASPELGGPDGPIAVLYDACHLL